ncbi:dephospho-CoA kinase, partial [Clavibacter michiganensis]|uniref:dephospho-CoA kinase n=1 Tax=Clavibacter michiganensis TaxID=28447 RepID=UPI00292F65A8
MLVAVCPPERGAWRIDAARLAREFVEPDTPALAEIPRRFGPGATAADGTLDRPPLGAVLSQDPDAPRDPEAVTHPAVRTLSAARSIAAVRADPHAAVAHTLPPSLVAARLR